MAKAATDYETTGVSAQEPGPSDNQFLGKRGKTLSWKNRVLVADPNRGTVEVQSKQYVTNNRGDYTTVRLPSRKNNFAIFVDPETETKPTISNTTDDGHSNVFLAKLNLDRLPGGVYNQILRSVGKLSTLYILNIKPLSETSSQVSDTVPQNSIQGMSL